MRVLVTGGRSYGGVATVYETLDQLDRYSLIDEIICGGATGADAIAVQWAMQRKVNFRVFYAKWTKYNNAAGPIRNQEMLDTGQPDYVVALPGGDGTADMVDKARNAGLAVWEIK